MIPLFNQHGTWWGHFQAHFLKLKSHWNSSLWSYWQYASICADDDRRQAIIWPCDGLYNWRIHVYASLGLNKSMLRYMQAERPPNMGPIYVREWQLKGYPVLYDCVNKFTTIIYFSETSICKFSSIYFVILYIRCNWCISKRALWWYIQELSAMKHWSDYRVIIDLCHVMLYRLVHT